MKRAGDAVNKRGNYCHKSAINKHYLHIMHPERLRSFVTKNAFFKKLGPFAHPAV
jgi:hypothetical protein